MNRIRETLNIYLKGCKVAYFSYFGILLITVVSGLLTTYVEKVLVDILSAQSSLGLSFNTEITLANIETNPLELAFINTFGGIEYLSTHLTSFLWLFLLFTVINAISSYARLVIRSYYNSMFSKNMQSRLFYHIERLPYSRIKELKPGDVLQAATRDEEVFRRFIAIDMHQIVYTIYVVTFSFIILALSDVKIALLSISFMPFLFIYSFFLIKKVRVLYKKTDDSESEMSGKIEENLNSVRLVKAYNNEKFEINVFKEFLDDYKQKFLNWRKTSAFFYGSSDVFIFCQIAFTTFIGFYFYYLYSKGDTTNGISLGTLFISITYTNMMVWPIREVATILSNLARASASLDRIRMILDEPLEDIDSGEKPSIKGTIEFKNVSFKFEDSNEYLLNDLSFKIDAGDTIAIMGKTGCGKSTLAYLLTRLYDINKGQILIDGIDIKLFSKKYLRQQVSTVLQDPFLFSKTIEDNIKIARPFASDNELNEASKVSHIYNTISRFEKGYKTPVGERGTSLSGGQKQRVAIARSLILDSPIIIFDDSLSAVDTETDKKIRESIKNKTNKITTLIITHRISSAREADKIIVLEKGKIESMGTHDELIKKDGLYKRIYDIQSKMV